jgi:hypothetical protein
MPKDDANKNYWANLMNANIDKLALPYKDPTLKETLAKVAEQHFNEENLGGAKVKQRNQAHVCSFFVRGQCNRGKTCPYRHSDISDQDLDQMKKGYGAIDDKIRDRYHGINDPVANKILSKIKEKSKLPEAPTDMSITTLFVGGVTEAMSE